MMRSSSFWVSHGARMQLRWFSDPIPTAMPMRRICQVQGGGHALCPHDTHVEQKPTEMMSHSSRSAISHLLPEIQRGPREDPNSTHATTEDPAIAQGISIKNEPVAGDGEPFPKGFVPALF